MSPRPFRNNLQKNDRVFDTESRRQGKVYRTPRDEQSRMTSIVFDGTHSPRYVDVMQLRFMPDGRTPEDVAPIDGEPPAVGKAVVSSAPAPRAPSGSDPKDILVAEREKAVAEMAEITATYKGLQKKVERLNVAIEALTGEGE